MLSSISMQVSSDMFGTREFIDRLCPSEKLRGHQEKREDPQSKSVKCQRRVLVLRIRSLLSAFFLTIEFSIKKSPTLFFWWRTMVRRMAIAVSSRWEAWHVNSWKVGKRATHLSDSFPEEEDYDMKKVLHKLKLLTEMETCSIVSVLSPQPQKMLLHRKIPFAHRSDSS